MTLNPFGRAQSPVEITQSRYLDALIAFRPQTCLSMEADDGGSGGQGGDGGTGDDAGAGGDQGTADDQGKGDSAKGFPADTPVAEMKPEEQAAYYKDKAKKHEDRNRALLAITGGKHGDDLRKDIEELGTLRKEKLTPSEQAIEEAKTAARAELLPQLAETAFRVAIGSRKTETEVDDFIADLNLTRFIKDGRVDTAKVLERVQQYAPGKGTDDGKDDFGQGKRGGGGGKTASVSSGADLYASRRGKSTSTS